MKPLPRQPLLFILIMFFVISSQSIHSQCPSIYEFTGEVIFDNFGGAAASAGDVNNDGYDDIVVGAWGHDAIDSSAGRVYVFSGLDGDTLYVFDGAARDDRFGIAVSSAGDVNSDGYADIFVGAHTAGGSGRAYVFSGKTGDTLFVFSGESNKDFFGTSVAPAGDVNGDGTPDLIIGASGGGGPGASPGKAYVFSGLDGDTLYVFSGEASRDVFGRTAVSAGDVNNDGYADLIISAHWNDAKGLQAGRVYVFSGFNGDTLHVFSGVGQADAFGFSVASAGDVNNDSFDDLIISALGNFLDGTFADSGRAYVFSGLNGDTLHIFRGEVFGDRFGWSVANAGDIDSDNYDDVIIGAISNNSGGTGAGRAYVYSGRTGGLLHVLTGAPFNNIGSTVASAGDVNKDGTPDLIVATQIVNNASGFVYVFAGSNGVCGDVNGDGFVLVNDLVSLIDFYFSSAGFPCGLGGDINSDGRIDISDIISLAQFLFFDGPAPCSASNPPPSFDPKKKPEGHKTGPTG